MITLDMNHKNIGVAVPDVAFSCENNIITLGIKMVKGAEDYSLTGKTITAIFNRTGFETQPLTVIDEIIKLPISNDMIAVGYNNIQLNFRTGSVLEQSPLMTWYIHEGLGGEISLESINIVSYLISQLNDFTNRTIVATEAAILATQGAVEATDNANNVADTYKSQLTEMDIPKLFFKGNISTATKEVEALLDFEYSSKLVNFNGACTVKWQGTSSLQYPKKNYTIKLYKDATKKEKLKIDINGWGKQNKFCLKANYIDHSHVRNVISARLWGDIVATRESVPELMAAAPNFGAINGFPIKLYVNGKYQGLYTWNIPKDGWMFNMDDDIPSHTILCAEIHDGAGAFRANAVIDGSDWSLEFPDDLSTEILTSFNNVINHVRDTDDATFVTNFHQYLDLEACIDYYCYAFIMCHLDGLGKNMLMVTYDGIKWYPSMYDMDSTWGLYFDGNGFVPYAYLFPNEYQCSNSLLWERLRTNYAQQIYDRYMTLRKGPLSIGSIFSKYDRFFDVIPEKLYDEDVVLWPDIPSAGTDHLKQIEDFVVKRSYYTDCIINSYVHKNMFDPKLAEANYYIDTSNGNEISDGVYYTSTYMAATEGNNYTLSGGGWSRIVYYDKDENFLGGFEGNGPLTRFAPANTRLVRISFPKPYIGTAMFEKGDTASAYVPYGM